MAIMTLASGDVFDSLSPVTGNVVSRTASSVSLSFSLAVKQAALSVKLNGSFDANGNILLLSGASFEQANGVTTNISFPAALNNQAFDLSGTTVRMDRLWGFLFAEDDWINLGDQADAVNLGGGADFVNANAGNDLLKGGAGDDTLIGGGGSDSALFNGSAASFRVQKTGGAAWTVIDKTAVEGSDNLTDVEVLQFADLVLPLTNLPRSGVPAYGASDTFLFDGVYYLLSHVDLARTTSLDAASQDYLVSGAAKGFAPNSWFSASYYETRWPDLAALNLDDATLFRHFNLYGVWEGRAPGPLFNDFNGNRYLVDNPDVAAYVDAHLNDFLGSRSNGALAHYIIYGANEGRVAYDAVGHGIDLNYTADLLGG